jgi:Ion channel
VYRSSHTKHGHLCHFFMTNKNTATHLAACSMYFCARWNDFGPETWIGSHGDVSHLSTLDCYVRSLWLSVVAFMTVGFGDYSAVNTAEMIIMLHFMMVNIVISSWFISHCSWSRAMKKQENIVIHWKPCTGTAKCTNLNQTLKKACNDSCDWNSSIETLPMNKFSRTFPAQFDERFCASYTCHRWSRHNCCKAFGHNLLTRSSLPVPWRSLVQGNASWNVGPFCRICSCWWKGLPRQAIHPGFQPMIRIERTIARISLKLGTLSARLDSSRTYRPFE